mgnify:CR=1 FL=1
MLLSMGKREFPYDPLHPRLNPRLGYPDTIMQALQQAGPHTEPSLSNEERAALQEIVLDTLETLTQSETWLLNMLLFERLSLRQVERLVGIPKTTVARKRDKILRKLEHQLRSHALVSEYLARNI